MKEIATLTVRQDPEEPRLKVRIYRGEEKFYIRIESDHPAIPTSMPMRITARNFRDAKRESEKLLHLTRGVFRRVLGKHPDLPDDMKGFEAEVPAFLHSLLTGNFLGQN
jgi:hypothetical protein